jgi:AraC-like DNA-binding protein
MDGRIFHLQERLLKNLEHPWTIGEMAKIADISPPHFHKLFKKEAGVPP